MFNLINLIALIALLLPQRDAYAQHTSSQTSDQKPMRLHSVDSIHLTLAPEWVTFVPIDKFHGNSMLPDTEGNVYVSGYHLGEKYGSKITIGSIVKLDKSGKILWHNKILPVGDGKVSQRVAQALAFDSNGSIVVTGEAGDGPFRYASADSPTGLEVMGVEYPPSRRFIHVAKYTPTGKLLWGKVVEYVAQGGASAEITYSKETGSDRIHFFLDRQDNIFFGGTCKLSTDDLRSVATKGDPAIVFGKLNSQGELLWRKVMNGPSLERFIAGGVDNEGNFCFSGTYTTPFTFEELTFSSLHKVQNAFVMKVSSNGKTVWTKTYGGWDVKGMTVGATGDLHVISEYTDSLYHRNFDRLKKRESNSLFLARFDAEGKMQWSKQLKVQWTVGESGIVGFHLGDDGYLYALGVSEGIFAETKGGKVEGFPRINDSDYAISKPCFLLKTDLNGEIHFLRTIPPAGYGPRVNGLAVDANSNLMISGTNYNKVVFKNEGRQESENDDTQFIAFIDALSLSDTGPDRKLLKRRASETFNMETCGCEGPSEEVGKTDLEFLGGNDYVRKLLTSIFFQKNTPAFQQSMTNSTIVGIHERFSTRIFLKNPLRFSTGSNAVAVDLTPCKKDAINISFIDALVLQPTAYPYNTPEERTRTIYDLAFVITNLTDEEVLDNLQKIDRLEGLVVRLESRFNVTFSPVTSGSDLVNKIRASGKSVNMRDEIYKSFRSDLVESIFPGFNHDKFWELVHPKRVVEFSITRFKMTFDRTSINSSFPDAMFQAEGVRWNDGEGLEVVGTKRFCMQPFQVGQTGVSVKLHQGLADLTEQSRAVYQDEQLAPVFMGLYEGKGEITIPMKDENLLGSVTQVSVDNRRVTGNLILTGNDMKKLQDVKKHMESLGFQMEFLKGKTADALRFTYEN
jgi:hypothetical protein